MRRTLSHWRTMLLCFSSFFLMTQSSCHPDAPIPINPDPVTPLENVDILALGDSYTKGESVVWEKNFPNQLKDSLLSKGVKVTGLRNIAQTGWRSDNLQTALNTNTNKDIKDSSFSVVTLCIGVNDQYQHKELSAYKIQFEQLLAYAINRAGGKKERVFVLSIPDWAYTPYGQNFSSSPSDISVAIGQFNSANKQITENYGVTYINVTNISQKGLAQPNLVAGDGLHPSADQYTEWVKVLLPAVVEALKK